MRIHLTSRVNSLKYRSTYNYGNFIEIKEENDYSGNTTDKLEVQYSTEFFNLKPSLHTHFQNNSFDFESFIKDHILWNGSSYCNGKTVNESLVSMLPLEVLQAELRKRKIENFINE